MLPQVPCWFAVQVKRRQEKSVAFGLRNKGYEEFVPVHATARSRRGVIVNQQEALFPGYVFCRIGDARYGLVVTTPGVIRILGMGNCPTPIDPVEINSLQLSCKSAQRILPCEFINAGDWVEVEDGPLTGVVGIFMERRNEHRIILSVSQCMRSVAVEVSGCRLRSLGKQRAPVVSSSSGEPFVLPRAV